MGRLFMIGMIEGIFASFIKKKMCAVFVCIIGLCLA
jgi:hypothetical protein